MPSKTFVVIVNYHCQDLVSRCVQSLENSVNVGLSYVVVDNSVSDDFSRWETEHHPAIILRSNYNLGFAGGCNMGIKYALDRSADYILLINPDVRTEHDFLTPLITTLEDEHTVGIVGPKIVEDSPDRQIWIGDGVKTLNWWLGGPRHARDNRNEYGGEVQYVPFLSGCCMLLRAQAVRQVGLMDERYFLYFEDADYVQRFLKAGWTVAYVAGAEILHAPSSTIGFQSEGYVYYFARNRIWFMRRWARWYHFMVFMVYTVIVKLPGAVVVFGLIRRKPRLVRAFFRGVLHGMLGTQRGTEPMFLHNLNG